MHDVLSERTGLDQAESAIPSINQQLAELARLGMSDFQIEGPTIYCRPMGFSSMHGDRSGKFMSKPAHARLDRGG